MEGIELNTADRDTPQSSSSPQLSPTLDCSLWVISPLVMRKTSLVSRSFDLNR